VQLVPPSSGVRVVEILSVRSTLKPDGSAVLIIAYLSPWSMYTERIALSLHRPVPEKLLRAMESRVIETAVQATNVPTNTTAPGAASCPKCYVEPQHQVAC